MDAQRGRRVFERSIEALHKLGRLGYGRPGSTADTRPRLQPARRNPSAAPGGTRGNLSAGIEGALRNRISPLAGHHQHADPAIRPRAWSEREEADAYSRTPDRPLQPRNGLRADVSEASSPSATTDASTTATSTRCSIFRWEARRARSGKSPTSPNSREIPSRRPGIASAARRARDRAAVEAFAERETEARSRRRNCSNGDRRESS